MYGEKIFPKTQIMAKIAISYNIHCFLLLIEFWSLTAKNVSVITGAAQHEIIFHLQEKEATFNFVFCY